MTMATDNSSQWLYTFLGTSKTHQCNALDIFTAKSTSTNQKPCLATEFFLECGTKDTNLHSVHWWHTQPVIYDCSCAAYLMFISGELRRVGHQSISRWGILEGQFKGIMMKPLAKRLVFTGCFQNLKDKFMMGKGRGKRSMEKMLPLGQQDLQGRPRNPEAHNAHKGTSW